MTTTSATRTVAERQFDVEDARGRTYRVTRYVWEEEHDGDWVELWDMLLTANGGLVDPLPDGEGYCVDGTATLVHEVPGSVRTRASHALDAVVPAGATGAH
ncbi:hypothetical protein [Variovorax sp. KK3]|uniref:hypothetical protein n=1 Tax=Variovorax sp. KK3 TaxID=1855728 RepID=UPI00097BD7E6|nr:hypothetical protein [Variovorax sp. KK3]